MERLYLIILILHIELPLINNSASGYTTAV